MARAMSAFPDVGLPPRRPAESVRLVALAGRGKVGSVATLIVHGGTAVLLGSSEADLALSCLDNEEAAPAALVATSLIDASVATIDSVLRRFPEARLLADGAVKHDGDSAVLASASDQVRISTQSADGSEVTFDVRVRRSAPQQDRPDVVVQVGTTRIVQVETNESAPTQAEPSMDLLVHIASGASRAVITEDLRRLRPKNVLPVVAESERMQYADAARDAGLGLNKVLWMSDGEVLDFARQTAFLTGAYPVESISAQVPSSAETERAHMAEAGVVNVFVVVDEFTGELSSDPSIGAAGVANEASVVQAVEVVVRRFVSQWAASDRHNVRELEEGLEVAVADIVSGPQFPPLVVTRAIAVRPR